MARVTDLSGNRLKEGDRVSLNLNGMFAGTIQEIKESSVMAVTGNMGKIKTGQPIPVVETPGKVQIVLAVDVMFDANAKIASCFKLHQDTEPMGEVGPAQGTKSRLIT